MLIIRIIFGLTCNAEWRCGNNVTLGFSGVSLNPGVEMIEELEAAYLEYALLLIGKYIPNKWAVTDSNSAELIYRNSLRWAVKGINNGKSANSKLPRKNKTGYKYLDDVNRSEI
ncbi:hypothetical protein ACFE04_019566 [Oxalis oulophora]